MNDRDPSRRIFLRMSGGLVLAGATIPLWTLLSGCADEADDQAATTGPVEIPLAMVPVGRRTVVDFHGKPVELLRSGGQVTARSLLCTHQGCEVDWHEDRQQYICPCHEGKFDADGNVVYGMPRRPLRLLNAEIAGEVIKISS